VVSVAILEGDGFGFDTVSCASTATSPTPCRRTRRRPRLLHLHPDDWSRASHRLDHLRTRTIAIPANYETSTACERGGGQVRLGVRQHQLPPTTLGREDLRLEIAEQAWLADSSPICAKRGETILPRWRRRFRELPTSVWPQATSRSTRPSGAVARSCRLSQGTESHHPREARHHAK